MVAGGTRVFCYRQSCTLRNQCSSCTIEMVLPDRYKSVVSNKYCGELFEGLDCPGGSVVSCSLVARETRTTSSTVWIGDLGFHMLRPDRAWHGNIPRPRTALAWRRRIRSFRFCEKHTIAGLHCGSRCIAHNASSRASPLGHLTSDPPHRERRKTSSGDRDV